MIKSLYLGLVLSLLVHTVSFASFEQNLSYGSSGTAVVELQSFLKTKGYLSTEPDGYFGLATRKAVIDFQYANNISPDGKWGGKSRAAAQSLSSTSAPIPTVSDSQMTISYLQSLIEAQNKRIIELEKQVKDLQPIKKWFMDRLTASEKASLSAPEPVCKGNPCP